MQGHRLVAPVILLTLLSIAGCNKEPAPAPAAVVAVGSNEIHVRVTPPPSGSTKWDVHHYVAFRDTVIWKADSVFSVKFNVGSNPCVATQSGKMDVLNSVAPTPTATPPEKRFTATCTIYDPDPGIFQYEIDPYLGQSPALSAPVPAFAAPAGAKGTVTSCNGCYLDSGGDD